MKALSIRYLRTLARLSAAKLWLWGTSTWPQAFGGHHQRRLVILDPGSFGGHHSEFSDAITEEAARRGYSVMRLVYDYARNTKPKSGWQQGIFHANPYLLAPLRNSRYPMPALLRDAAVIYRDLREFTRIEWCPGDIIVWHTITTAHLAALARWYGHLAAPRPRLFVQFQFPVDFPFPVDERHSGELSTPEFLANWRSATHELYRTSSLRLNATGGAKLATNSRQLQADYAAIAS